MQESINECTDKWNNKSTFISLTFSPFLPLKSMDRKIKSKINSWKISSASLPNLFAALVNPHKPRRGTVAATPAPKPSLIGNNCSCSQNSPIIKQAHPNSLFYKMLMCCLPWTFFALLFIIKMLYKILLIIVTEGLDTPLDSVPKVSASLSWLQPTPADQTCLQWKGVMGREREPWLHSRVTWEVLKALHGPDLTTDQLHQNFWERSPGMVMF